MQHKTCVLTFKTKLFFIRKNDFIFIQEFIKERNVLTMLSTLKIM